MDQDHDRHLDADATAARFEQVVEFDASIDAVWGAISDSAELSSWLGASVELDARPGGRGRVVDDDGTVREVIVTDVRSREQIAWHWWSDDGDLSSVELRLDEHEGLTRLRIIETTLIPSAEPDRVQSNVARCARRWSGATSRLWCRVGAGAFA